MAAATPARDDRGPVQTPWNAPWKDWSEGYPRTGYFTPGCVRGRHLAREPVVMSRRRRRRRRRPRPRLLNRLFVYSAGRAIVPRDAPPTQICSPTAQNTQKPTPTKETTKGGGRLRGCWFLCILGCWATYLCCWGIS